MLRPIANQQATDNHKEQFKIRVKGYLGPSWSEFFGDLKVTNSQNGETILAGSIVDQAELHGILARIRDLNLILISVSRIESEYLPSGDHNSDVQ